MSKVLTVPYLDQSLLNNPKYFNRKGAYVLSFLVNVENAEVIPIPIGKEHIEIVTKYLRLSMDELRANLDLVSHLVPFMLQFAPSDHLGCAWQLKMVLIGVSGLEIGFKVRHTKKQIDTAHDLAWKFISYGKGIYVDKRELEERVERRYQKK